MIYLLKVTLLLLICFSGSLRVEAQSNGQTLAVASLPSGKIEEVAVKGQLAPDFSLINFKAGAGERRETRLRDFRGKWVLLNFWATWCPPCIAEMPALARLEKILEGENFVILSINVDEEKSASVLEKFIKLYGISFSVLRDMDLVVAKSYGVSGFPESFLIAPDGKFASMIDPSENREVVRMKSDRPWDSSALVQVLKDTVSP